MASSNEIGRFIELSFADKITEKFSSRAESSNLIRFVPLFVVGFYDFSHRTFKQDIYRLSRNLQSVGNVRRRIAVHQIIDN